MCALEKNARRHAPADDTNPSARVRCAHTRSRFVSRSQRFTRESVLDLPPYRERGSASRRFVRELKAKKRTKFFVLSMKDPSFDRLKKLLINCGLHF